MDVSPRFFCVVLACVQVEALRRADRPSNETYQLSNIFVSFRKINSKPEQVKRPNPRKIMTMTMMMMMNSRESENVVCPMKQTSINYLLAL
jgi:hypothetical protein